MEIRAVRWSDQVAGEDVDEQFECEPASFRGFPRCTPEVCPRALRKNWLGACIELPHPTWSRQRELLSHELVLELAHRILLCQNTVI
jgi:hypothetical protein